MDNFNIDNFYEEIPEFNKFDVLQDYLDYKKNPNDQNKNKFMEKYNFYVKNIHHHKKNDNVTCDFCEGPTEQIKNNLHFIDCDAINTQLIHEKDIINSSNKNKKNSQSNELKKFNDWIKKYIHDHVPIGKQNITPDNYDFLASKFLNIKKLARDIGRKYIISKKFSLDRLINYIKRKDLLKYIDSSISRPTYNKYKVQRRATTKKIHIPYSMNAVKLKMYLDRRRNKYY